MRHGHVVPNEDGSVARCGGPGICATCMAEEKALRANADEQARVPLAGGTAARMEYLYDRLCELVTKHGPRHLIRGHRSVDAHEAMLECIEKLVAENEQLKGRLTNARN